MIEKIGGWIFPLKSGFSIGYGIDLKVSANLGFGISIGPKQKFQVQDSFSEYFFLEIWRFGKRIAFSKKKYF